MKRLRLWTWLLLWLAGCATTSAHSPGVASAPPPEAGALDRLSKTSDDQGRRIAELEARLSLLEREAREQRERSASKAQDTVRIGAHRPAPAPAFVPDADRGPVEVVRLYEPAPAPVPAAPLELPPAPAYVATRLPVVPLPEARLDSAADSGDASTPVAERDELRSALRLVRERKWEEALGALQRFLRDHGSSSLVASASYWEGEVQYAQRRYEDAQRAFERVLARFPDSPKAPDALLKLGLCHLRLGDAVSARRYFQRVREQYPSSDAARIASREGSS